MNFEKNQLPQKVGERLGFIFAYFLFTTILFFVLWFIRKSTIPYYTVASVSFLVALIGLALKRLI